MISKDDNVVTVAPPSFKFDVDNMSYADFKEMMKAGFPKMFSYAEKCLTSWTFKQPFELGAISKLPIEQAAAIYRSVMEAINEDVTKTAKTIKVNFAEGEWTMETIEEFIAHDEAGRVDKLTEMMLKICRFPMGKQPTATSVTAVEGQAMFNAIMQKWNDVLTGKN